MADNRTEEQKMLERPVKGYQLRELTNVVNEFKDDVGNKLSEILNNVKGVATTADLEEAKAQLRKEFDEKLADEIRAIHLKYSPTYKGIWWVVAAIGAGLIGILVGNIWGPK